MSTARGALTLSFSFVWLTLAAAPAVSQVCNLGLTTERVSVSSGGQQGDDRSVLPAVSGNGCTVAFKSYATNLVANDHNGKVDVFLRDRDAHTTQRIPITPAFGAEPNDNSFPPAMSRNASIIVFSSLSTNLVIGDFNMSPDVFLYESDSNIATPLTIVYDQNGEGIGGGGAPDLPSSVSGTGNLVAYTSAADDLVPNDHNEVSDVFVYNADVLGPELISVAGVGALAGQAANGRSAGGAISADGCVVAFYSEATNLIAGDTNGVQDVYVRNRCDGTTELISKSSAGVPANAASQASGFLPSVSADGRYVVFASDATNLDPADTNHLTDVFVRDREAGTTRLVSKNAAGEPGNGPSQYGSISADGRFIAFQSAATNLVEGDNNGHTDIFAVELESGEIQRVSVPSSGGEANGPSTAPQIAADGITVVFESTATNLVPDDTNTVADIFLSVNELSFTATPTATPTPGEFCNSVCAAGQGCRRESGGTVVDGVCLPEQNCVCSVGTPTPTPTAGEFCNSLCAVGQGCRRESGGIIVDGVCLPEQNCVCSIGTPTPTATAPTPTPTATGGTSIPTQTPTPDGFPTSTVTPTGPTRTPIGPTATPTAGRKKGSGGGCNCWIDPQSESTAESLPLAALLAPAALLVWRRRKHSV